MGNSWYIEILLRNREQIRSNIVTKTEVPFDIEEDVDLDDDTYNDLLIVEKALDDLITNNQLSKKEKLVVRLILDHKTLAQIKELTSMDEETTSLIFNRVCSRLAFILGGEFTDSGFLDMFAEKHNLTNEQKEIAKNFMTSNRRYSRSTKETKC